jgi:hypothetical protein
LPALDYSVAFGQLLDPEAMEQASGDLDFLFGLAGTEIEGVDKEKLSKLQGLVKDLIGSMRAARGTLDLLAPGPDGLFGFALVIETADSERWLTMLNESTGVGKELVMQAAKAQALKEGEDEKEAEEFVNAITYTKDVETVSGAKVSHLKVDFEKYAKMNEADEEEIEEARKVIGKDGLLLRVAAADAKNVVLSFGGGEARLTQFLGAAKSSEAPLAKSAGIEKVSTYLPKERAAVVYFAVDRILERVKEIQKFMEEEPLPIQVPPIHAPAAMAVTGGDGWAQYDIFLPTELMLAGKNAAMTMMMGQPAAEPAETPE